MEKNADLSVKLASYEKYRPEVFSAILSSPENSVSIFFCEEVHITITELKSNSIHIRQINIKAITYLLCRGIFKRMITGKNLQG